MHLALFSLFLLVLQPLVGQTGIRGIKLPSSFQEATSLAVDPAGFLFVTDAGSNTVQKLSVDGKHITTIGGYGWRREGMDHPSDVATPNGIDVYVTDYGNNRVMRFDRNLNLVSTIPGESPIDAKRRFGYPRSIALSRFGTMFLIDSDNRRLVKFVDGGEIDPAFAEISAKNGVVREPSRARVSSNDRLYVRDGSGILVFDIFGNQLAKIADSTIGKLQSFAVTDSVVYLLDACEIRQYTADGIPLGKEEIVLFPPGATDCSDVVEISVFRNTLYVLTRKGLYRFSLP